MNLPEEVSIWKGEGEEDLPEPSEEVKLALAHLARVDCLVIDKSWHGGEIFKRVNRKRSINPI